MVRRYATLCILAIPFSVAVFGQAPPPAPAWVVWSGGDCKITYPAAWRADDSGSQGASVVFFSPQDSADKFLENVNLMIQEQNGRDPKAFLEATRDEVGSQLENGVLVRGEVRGSDRVELEYTGDLQGVTLHFRQVALFRNGQVYLLTYTALASTYDEYLYLAEAMFGSLAFKP